MKRPYGWIPDVPDIRDYTYAAIRKRVRIPKTVDLRGDCSPVENQGQLGSCTAQALAGNLEFNDVKASPPYTDVSRLFIYYNERALIGTVREDSGAMLRDGIKTLKNNGVCAESLWPYRLDAFAKKPTVPCYTAARKSRIRSYHRIFTHAERANCLAEGFPFVFGFAVYESFESARVARSGVVPMPKKSEKMLGGHAVMAVGFDDRSKRFLVRNSWGTVWGQEGYCTMPFDYLEQLADDFWTIRK